MRLIACGLSAVLLSGCSWLGGVGNMLGGGSHQAANQAGQYGAQGAYNQPRANPCEIPAANHPIPRGCHPSQVTVGTGGFAQQPNFGAGGQYAGAGYGSHAADAQAHAAHRGQRAPKLRKPRFRASLAYGVEKSKGGNLLDYADVTFDPVGGYNPQDYNEGTTTGSIANGSTTAITYTANDRNPPGDNIFAPNSYEEAIRPDVSFDDAHHAPTKLTLGGEYILNKNTTLFGQVGYLHGAGEVGDAAVVNATLYRHQQTTNYDDTGAITSVDAPVVAFMPNETIARFQYDFSDTERYDMEVGARRL